MDLSKFIARYPKLYHMAESGTWQSIQQHGLLSTSAILDKHGITGPNRYPYETMHRNEMMTVTSGQAPNFVLRDQKPMPVERLMRVLPSTITPGQWYLFLNKRVFLWATRARLLKLLSGKEYRDKTHDVLEIDSASFAAEYQNQIEICHMNSGNTKPYLHDRDFSIFTSLSDYPVRRTGNPVKEVAEVTVPYHIPTIASHVITVKEMKGPEIISEIYRK